MSKTKTHAQAGKKRQAQHTQPSDESPSNSDVEVNFEMFNMDLGDFHGIRTFLTQSFGQRYTDIIDAGCIAKMITDDLSEDVGTTIKTDGEGSDPYGYASLVPLSFKGNRKAVDMLKAFCIKTCSSDKLSFLKADLEAVGTSIVFMDRFVNLPSDLASPLLKQLLDDLKNAIKEDPIFKTSKVIISTPTYVELESDVSIEVEADGDEGPKPKMAKKSKTATAHKETKFYYGEAEMLEELSEYSWSYKIDSAERVSDSKRAFGDLGIESSRKVYVLTWQNFYKFVQSIDQFISS